MESHWDSILAPVRTVIVKSRSSTAPSYPQHPLNVDKDSSAGRQSTLPPSTDTYSFSHQTDLLKLAKQLAPLGLTQKDLQYLEKKLQTTAVVVDNVIYQKGMLDEVAKMPPLPANHHSRYVGITETSVGLPLPAHDDALYRAGKLIDGRIFIVTEQGYVYFGKPSQLRQLSQVESTHFRFENSQRDYNTYRTLDDHLTPGLLITLYTQNLQEPATIHKISRPTQGSFPQKPTYESLPISQEHYFHSFSAGQGSEAKG